MTDLDHRVPDGRGPKRGSRPERRLLGLGALLLLLGGLAIGVWRHYALHLEVTATAAEHRDFILAVDRHVPCRFFDRLWHVRFPEMAQPDGRQEDLLSQQGATKESGAGKWLARKVDVAPVSRN